MPFRTEHLTPAINGAPDALFRLTSVGLFQSLGNFRWEMVAWRYALHCVRKGKGIVVEDGKAHEVGPGDAFLQWPGRHYRYFDQPGEPWRYDFMTMEGDIPKDLLPQAPVFDAASHLWRVIDDATNVFRADAVHAAQAARLGWSLVEAMVPHRPPTVEPDLVSVLQTIAQRRDTVLPTVAQIARDLGMDRTTLYRRFRQITGGPIKPWLDQLRMTRAEELLTHSDAPIREIAAICGFRDPLYFSRAFAQRHGVPPGLWRQERKQSQ